MFMTFQLQLNKTENKKGQNFNAIEIRLYAWVKVNNLVLFNPLFRVRTFVENGSKCPLGVQLSSGLLIDIKLSFAI